MPHKGKDNDRRISVLYMPDGVSAELYLWYDGNPFMLSDRRSSIVGLDGCVYHTEAIIPEVKGVFKDMYSSSGAIGYLIARSNVLLAGVERRDWNRASREILKFFGGSKSTVMAVEDKNHIIAQTKLPKRIVSVRDSQPFFTSHAVPELSLRNFEAEEQKQYEQAA